VIEQDIDKALQCFLKAAELGEPIAIYWVGYSYLNGQHLKKDLKKGLEMVRHACDLGYPQALYCMYLMYLEGHEALPRDPVKADAMLKAAVKARSGDALFDMADRCFHGTHGEEKNLQRALKLYEDAGRVRHGAALYCAATMYYYGMGTERNLELAYERYTQAATAGYEDALVSIAKMTLRGEGVEKNEPYARYLLSELRSRGIPFDEKDFE
jgi:TPR repeat protein